MILFIPLVGTAQPDGVDIPSEPADRFEALLLEERVLESLRAGDRLEAAIRHIVRDELARQAKANPSPKAKKK